MGRHFSGQYQITSSNNLAKDIIDDPYTRISKKNEGNIGGTLSNARHKSAIEVRAPSSCHTDGSSVMELDFQLR